MEGEVSRCHSWHAVGLWLWLVVASLFVGCGGEAPPMGEAVTNRDSLPMMVTHGVTKLISDSGVIKYKITAEEWLVYDRTTPPRQYFPKGIYLERYDAQFKPNLTITADTAYCYNQNLWEMRGNVRIVNKEDGTRFSSNELFWDMAKHLLYSRQYFHIQTPDKDIEGNWFESDENMNYYHVKRTKGFVPMLQEQQKAAQPPRQEASTDEATEETDSLPDNPRRAAPVPTRRGSMSIGGEE